MIPKIQQEGAGCDSSHLSSESDFWGAVHGIRCSPSDIAVFASAGCRLNHSVTNSHTKAKVKAISLQFPFSRELGEVEQKRYPVKHGGPSLAVNFHPFHVALHLGAKPACRDFIDG